MSSEKLLEIKKVEELKKIMGKEVFEKFEQYLINISNIEILKIENSTHESYILRLYSEVNEKKKTENLKSFFYKKENYTNQKKKLENLLNNGKPVSFSALWNITKVLSKDNYLEEMIKNIKTAINLFDLKDSFVTSQNDETIKEIELFYKIENDDTLSNFLKKKDIKKMDYRQLYGGSLIEKEDFLHPLKSFLYILPTYYLLNKNILGSHLVVPFLALYLYSNKNYFMSQHKSMKLYLEKMCNIKLNNQLIKDIPYKINNFITKLKEKDNHINLNHYTNKYLELNEKCFIKPFYLPLLTSFFKMNISFSFLSNFYRSLQLNNISNFKNVLYLYFLYDFINLGSKSIMFLLTNSFDKSEKNKIQQIERLIDSFFIKKLRNNLWKQGYIHNDLHTGNIIIKHENNNSPLELNFIDYSTIVKEEQLKNNQNDYLFGTSKNFSLTDIINIYTYLINNKEIINIDYLKKEAKSILNIFYYLRFGDDFITKIPKIKIVTKEFKEKIEKKENRKYDKFRYIFFKDKIKYNFEIDINKEIYLALEFSETIEDKFFKKYYNFVEKELPNFNNRQIEKKDNKIKKIEEFVLGKDYFKELKKFSDKQELINNANIEINSHFTKKISNKLIPTLIAGAYILFASFMTYNGCNIDNSKNNEIVNKKNVYENVSIQNNGKISFMTYKGYNIDNSKNNEIVNKKSVYENVKKLVKERNKNKEFMYKIIKIRR